MFPMFEFSGESVKRLTNIHLVAIIQLTNKTTYEYLSVFEKNDFLTNIWFSVDLFHQIKMKFLQTFIMIGDDTTMC